MPAGAHSVKKPSQHSLIIIITFAYIFSVSGGSAAALKTIKNMTIRIPDGNAFRIRLTARNLISGEYTEAADLSNIDNLVINYVRRGIRFPHAYTIDEEGRATVADAGTLDCGFYGIELTGYYGGEKFRFYGKDLFEITTDTTDVIDPSNLIDIEITVKLNASGVSKDYVDHAVNGMEASMETMQADLRDEIAEAGKVDDVKVNGVSVVSGKKANITVPTKVSDLDNDSEYQNEQQVQQKVDAAKITSADISVDGGTGTPSGSAGVSGNQLVIALHNIKGEKGDPGESIVGPQGPQGDSAVYDPSSPDAPDFVMANTTGQSTTKAMTQKAVTEAIVEGNVNTGYNPINESQYPANLENISIEMADRGFTAEVIRKKGTSGNYFFGITCTIVSGKTYQIEFDYDSDWSGSFSMRDGNNDYVFGSAVPINSGIGHVSYIGTALLDAADFSFALPQATPVGSSLTVSNLTITAISKANAKSNQLESDVSVLQQDSIRYSDTGYNPLGKSQIDANDEYLTITPADNGFTAEVILKKGSSTSAYFVGITCKALKVGKTYKIEFDYDSDWSGGFSFRNDEEANILSGMSYSTGTGHISVVKEATGDSESFTFTLPQNTSVGSEMSITNLTIEEVVKIKNVALQSEEDIDELKNALTTYKTKAYKCIIRSTNVENYAKEFDFEDGKEYTIKMSIPEAATSSVSLICYQSRSDGTGRIAVVGIPVGKTSAQVTRTIPVANKYIGVWSSEVKSYYCTIEISENVIVPKVEKEEKVEHNEVSVNLSSFLDGTKTDSECIDDCLSFVNSFHKKTIAIDSDLMIDKAILLDSNTTVLLQDCTIQLNNGVYDNIFRGANIVLPEPNSDDNMFYVPEDISYLENVHIIGDGNSKLLGCNVNRIYDGSRVPSYQGQAMVGDQYGARAVGVCFTCINGGSIEGVSFEKNRSYAMQLEYCSDFTIKDIAVTSDCKNGDGIDVRTGCRNITIKNFGGVTSDDLIAINSALSDKDENTFYVCPMKYSWKWEKNISDDLKEIKGVYIDNIVNEAGSNHHAVVSWSAGNSITDVSINNVIIRGDITSDNIGHIALFGQGTTLLRTYKNVRVSNIFFDKASDPYPAVVLQNIVDGMIADVRRANNTLVSLGDTGNALLFNIQ